VSGETCTVEQEFSLFKKSLELQVRLLGGGSVEGIEFFSDDHFSYPETASSSACKPQRKRECVRNTEKMRSLARAELSVTAPSPEGG
jgi:hypothetical protein